MLVSETRYIVELMNMLDVQMQEMKSMSNAIQKLEGIEKLLCVNKLIFTFFCGQRQQSCILYTIKYFASWFGAKCLYEFLP